jgi:hypothetical protein
MIKKPTWWSLSTWCMSSTTEKSIGLLLQHVSIMAFKIHFGWKRMQQPDISGLHSSFLVMLHQVTNQIIDDEETGETSIPTTTCSSSMTKTKSQPCKTRKTTSCYTKPAWTASLRNGNTLSMVHIDVSTHPVTPVVQPWINKSRSKFLPHQLDLHHNSQSAMCFKDASSVSSMTTTKICFFWEDHHDRWTYFHHLKSSFWWLKKPRICKYPQ